MAGYKQIQNPGEWGSNVLHMLGSAVVSVGHALNGRQHADLDNLPRVNKISFADLRDALMLGIKDFAACRSDVIFLCLIYPLAGLLLARFALRQDMLPLLFPMVTGFALLGPLAAVGVYELSRQRMLKDSVQWTDAFAVFKSPAFGAIFVLGLLLIAVFLTWMVAAHVIYTLTLGPGSPLSFSAFVDDVTSTPAGWAMTIIGIGVGAAFAAVVLAISVVSYPMLLDRDVGVYGAVATSIRAVMANKMVMAQWGAIVAISLLAASIPLLIGLVIVLPVLGHATWYLYRKVVESDG